MLPFFGLFVVQRPKISTGFIIDNVFDVVSSLSRTALCHDLTKHFTNNPKVLDYYSILYSLDRLLEKLKSFPPELVDEFLILLLQSDNHYTKNLGNFSRFVAEIGEFQEKSKWVCSRLVVDAIARKISTLLRGSFLGFRSRFERMLMKSKSLGTAEETPSLCNLLNSLTRDELSIPLAKCLLFHCHQSNDKLVEFLTMEAKKSIWSPALFELMLLLPIERRTMLVEFFKTDPNLGRKFIGVLFNAPSDFDTNEFLNLFFVSSDKDPTFLKRMGYAIVNSSNEEVVKSFLTHLIQEKSWLKPEYFIDLVNMIRYAVKSHSSETYRPLICALFDPSLYTKETLPDFPNLLETIEGFYLSRPDKISSGIAQACVKLVSNVQEKDRKTLSMLPEFAVLWDDQSKEILGELLPEI